MKMLGYDYELVNTSTGSELILFYYKLEK
jgi:hypothetical protein